MDPQQMKDEVRREREKLKKRRQRQLQKDKGLITDEFSKRKKIIQNICEGKKTRVDLTKFKISIDMIPCDLSLVHPDVLEELIRNEEETIDEAEASTSASTSTSTSTTTPAIVPKKIKISVRKKPVLALKSMSQEYLNTVFDTAQQSGHITETTCSNYKGDFNILIKLLKCPENSVIPCFSDVDKVITCLKQRYPNVATYKKMLSPIISLGKYDEWFRSRVDIERYRKEMTEMRKIVGKIEEDKANNGETTQWSEYVELRKALSKDEPCGIRHLIMCMYTMLPPVRDNYGRIYLVTEEAEEVPEDELSTYDMRTGRLIVGQYKTGKYYGVVDIIVPKKLQRIIKKSFDMKPRRYLITKDGTTDQIYHDSRGGKLSSIMTSRFFDFDINDLRHSFGSYIDQNHSKFSYTELNLIHQIMGHSAKMADMYARRGSEEGKSYATKKNNISDVVESICEKMGGNE
jgi:hypothetical protein